MSAAATSGERNAEGTRPQDGRQVLDDDVGVLPDPVLEQFAGAGGPAAVQALRRLLAGNYRFRTGRPAHPRQSAARRYEVAAAQRPIAMLLGCADSRVPAEIIFDQGIGDLCGQRVAGHVPDSCVLGSIEYAAEHLEVPLLVVLGHGGCAAVAATVHGIRTGAAPAGHLGAVVAEIRPAVSVLARADGFGPNGLRQAELANVRHVVRQVPLRSEIVRSRVEQGRLAVVGAFYDLPSGRVSLLH